MKPVIQTSDGHYLNLLEPRASAIGIESIAHALSHLCRFTGHTYSFYSVAQHSVLVSLLVPEDMAREGLLHDAQEAFIGDVATPLKRLLPDYLAIEERFESVIAERFGLTWTPETRRAVKQADMTMLATERRDLLGRAKEGMEWAALRDVLPLSYPVQPMRPENAKRAFLDRAKELGLGMEDHP